MDTITLQIPRAEAEKMLPFFESRRKLLREELSGVEAQIAAIESNIAASSAPASATPRRNGRAKKGQTKKLIVEYLKSLPGLAGASITQIAKESGASYTSTHRVLKAMKATDEAVLKNDLWSLKS